jgi:hypothetical protein
MQAIGRIFKTAGFNRSANPPLRRKKNARPTLCFRAVYYRHIKRLY